MDVRVFLGDAFRFVTFEKERNMFMVQSKFVSPSDVGEYRIEVKATFFNSTFSETYKKSFMLTIWDDTSPPSEKEPWFPPNPIFYPDWKPQNYKRGNMTQKIDPERPVPYIVDLSSTGMLKIGWNKEMAPPQNFTEIPPTMIAVEEGIVPND